MANGTSMDNKWLARLPNQLTTLRIILTPLFLFFLISGGFLNTLLALLVFIVASTTDAYDGYLARKYQVVSAWGKFVDPLADKILVLSAFAAIWFMGLYPLWMFILIAIRDVGITALRLWMISRNSTLETSYFAKSKTVVQMVAIYSLLAFFLVKAWPLFTGVHPQLRWLQAHGGIWWLMLVVTLLTVASGVHYIYVNRANIKRLLAAKS